MRTATLEGYSNYVVYENGLVFSFLTNEFLEGSRNPAGYVNFRLTDDNGVCKTWGRHRLLGWCFLRDENWTPDLVVNHGNGIKGDDRLNNLEWVTNLENIHHAGEAGLSPKCLPVQLRNIDTKEVLDFPSIIDCARHLGLHKDVVSDRVSKGPAFLYPGRLQFRYKSTDEWETPTESAGIFVRNVLSGEVKLFPFLARVAEEYGFSPAAATKWIRLENQPVLPGMIQMKRELDETPWRHVNDPIAELSRFLNTRPVVAREISTGKETVFVSAVECARAFNINVTTLHYRLNLKSAKTFKGYQFYFSPLSS